MVYNKIMVYTVTNTVKVPDKFVIVRNTGKDEIHKTILVNFCMEMATINFLVLKIRAKYLK